MRFGAFFGGGGGKFWGRGVDFGGGSKDWRRIWGGGGVEFRGESLRFWGSLVGIEVFHPGGEFLGSFSGISRSFPCRILGSDREISGRSDLRGEKGSILGGGVKNPDFRGKFWGQKRRFWGILCQIDHFWGRFFRNRRFFGFVFRVFPLKSLIFRGIWAKLTKFGVFLEVFLGVFVSNRSFLGFIWGIFAQISHFWVRFWGDFSQIGRF